MYSDTLDVVRMTKLFNLSQTLNNTHMLSYLQTAIQIHVQSAQKDRTVLTYKITNHKYQDISMIGLQSAKCEKALIW